MTPSALRNLRRLSSASGAPIHSLKRKQSLTLARPYDNAGSVTARVDETFSLRNTIFKTLARGSMLEKVQLTKLDTVLEWTPEARASIEAAYESISPLPASGDADLHRFMMEECHFDSEHADGSFLDHLHFCRDFTALHYPAGSPRVMLLHSICGVGTNAFPLAVEKLPALAALLRPEEMAQVQAFPSVLRLIIHGPLLQELSACTPAKLGTLRSIRFHRVLDNAAVELSAPQLWEALHYQLIHAIDFLPAAAWKRTSNEIFFRVYIGLYRLLTSHGLLQANVSWDDEWMRADTDGARPPTWRHWAIDMLPDGLVMRLASKQIHKYSSAIGHSLEYSLCFADAAEEMGGGSGEGAM